MEQLNSTITGKQGSFGQIRDNLEPEGFTLANWDYDRGFFDRQLDDRAMVFLRLPIEVRHGHLDEGDAQIEFGTPFVLKHVYQTGVEENVGYQSSKVAAPLMNQFQEPIEKDAPLDEEWVQKAEMVLHRIEQKLEQT
ncbi:YugN-like family protein [Brevibacillus humidisoli]|uniref:YugN family protein n=1 Tax=Brevibacillus humidisoli TaxID=2895522 RepID=UPI001E59D88E|nr:YugN family protein [Brevibacillus humidisoli]UFJ41196.1 YugN-like family protein [Brevibacillus humidisoli]